MDLAIRGKKALVTGASSGLGLATAAALQAEGADVVLVSRSADKLEAAANSLPSYPKILTADLSDPDAINPMITAAEEALGGGIDILIANAGGPQPGTFASIDLDAYPAALQLNLLSTVAMCKRLIPDMQERGWGRVVAITSTSVREPMAQIILSNTARAGLTAFLKTTAREVAGDGVTVNTVQPGMHRTDRLTSIYPDLEQLAQSVPSGTIGDPDDFGSVVTFLCSDQAKYITGASVPVDGGASHGLQ